VDIYPSISLDMLAPDGLHLTQEGNQRVVEIFSDAIERLFRAVR
jgi:lysophospholipase L1-like esterase